MYPAPPEEALRVESAAYRTARPPTTVAPGELDLEVLFTPPPGQKLDDRYGQAQTLINLGEVHAELDDPQQARRAWTAAAQLFAAVGAENDADRVRQQIADLDR